MRDQNVLYGISFKVMLLISNRKKVPFSTPMYDCSQPLVNSSSGPPFAVFWPLKVTEFYG